MIQIKLYETHASYNGKFPNDEQTELRCTFENAQKSISKHAPEIAMKCYEVTFYREVVNSSGRPYHSPLSTVFVQRARDPGRAEKAAKLRIARARQEQRLHKLASGVDVVDLGEPSAVSDSGRKRDSGPARAGGDSEHC